MAARRYTWNGMNTFMSIERAAEYALDFNKNPYDLGVLEDGKVTLADDWEVNELLMHMRDQAPLL